MGAGKGGRQFKRRARRGGNHCSATGRRTGVPRPC